MRRWIAKAGSNKMRPLGIPVLEDKIAQQAVRMILEPIWENDFADESIGYRPGRSPRKATQELSHALHDGKHRWVVEADIRGFFDPQAQAARPLELLWHHRQLRPDLELRVVCEETGPQVAQPAQPAQKLHRHVLRGCVGALANAGATVGRGGAATGRWTRPAPSRIKSSNKIPIVIEVPPARIPEEPGAVIPHAGICEGGVGQPASLP